MGSTEAIQHSNGTSHFRCACGQHVLLADSSASAQILAVANYKREADLKRGECPVCGISHWARIHAPRAGKSNVPHDRQPSEHQKN
jgi:hypothetical protein